MAILLQRLCWNSNGWRGPTGEAFQKEKSYVGTSGVGHEEWNLNTADLIDGKVYGYTYYNPPPSGRTPLGPHDIYFFAVAPDKTRLLVGAYHNAYFLNKTERQTLKKNLERSDYLDRRVDEILALDLPNLVSKQDANQLLVRDFAINVCAEPEYVVTFSPPQLLRSSDIGDRDPLRLNRYTTPVFLDRSPATAAAPAQQTSDSVTNGSASAELLLNAYLRFTPAQRRVIVRRHNLLSNRFKSWLAKVGATAINVESESVDVSCVYSEQSCLFELKTCYGQSTRHALREALGQILEYSFYPGRRRSDKLSVVLDAAPSAQDVEWFQRLSAIGVTVELFWLIGEEVYSARSADSPLAKKAREPNF